MYFFMAGDCGDGGSGYFNVTPGASDYCRWFASHSSSESVEVTVQDTNRCVQISEKYKPVSGYYRSGLFIDAR